LETRLYRPDPTTLPDEETQPAHDEPRP